MYYYVFFCTHYFKRLTLLIKLFRIDQVFLMFKEGQVKNLKALGENVQRELQ